MAPRTPREVQDEIKSWIDCYKEDKIKLDLWTDEIINPEHDWNYLNAMTNVLRIKYDFLPNFMNSKGINIVKEATFNENILTQSWKITEQEDDINWTIYYVVQNNSKIIQIPYEQTSNYTDMSDDDIEIDEQFTWKFNWETVWDYISQDTTQILMHNYSTYWNDMSPLTVFPYLK